MARTARQVSRRGRRAGRTGKENDTMPGRASRCIIVYPQGCGHLTKVMRLIEGVRYDLDPFTW